MLGERHIKARFGDLSIGETFWIWVNGQEVHYWKISGDLGETVYAQQRGFDDEDLVNVTVGKL
jgi:hypothetical protein